MAQIETLTAEEKISRHVRVGKSYGVALQWDLVK
jgi:hypothetical protein